MNNASPLILAIGLALAPACIASAATTASGSVARQSELVPVLVTTAQWAQMREQVRRYPLFAGEAQRAERRVRAMMEAGIDVPVPKDKGGGYTHEQHKRNYQAIQAAGALYRLSGDQAYADFVRDMLLRYAELYPTLGPHPQGRGQIPGRLFWQTLNDSVWLVTAVQGYDAVRDAIDPASRETIDNQVFRRMAGFLAGAPENFDKIHNHATWAVAATGMTGYMLRDPVLVEQALKGSARDGKAGFLKQIDQLFSPDGYYEEGPYYQRYALAPFVLFANAIERNEPQRGIFDYRDGVLLKAVDALVQSSYGGYFFPINDAILDKGLDTEELVAGIGIAYARRQDPRLLSIAQLQGRVTLTPEGLQVAQALAADKARPYDFRSTLLRDGSAGDQGALAILRMGGAEGQALVAKNTMQGMGHGHFDRLNWLFYDNGQRVVTDYGAARFLNIEAKAGGIYLPENTSWAKQTVAHNTLVVDGASQFGGDWKKAERFAPEQLLFAGDAQTWISGARIDTAYDGVAMHRTQALLSHPALGQPVALDLLRVEGGKAATYDLPLHFNGHIMTVGFEARRNVAQRPLLGKANGYQHLWVDATSEASAAQRTLSWLLDGRFYTYRFASTAPSQALLVESGANDPDFNLRREPALIQRVEGQASTTFYGVLEPHGQYDGAAETVRGANSRIDGIEHFRGGDASVLLLRLAGGATVAVGIADDPRGTGTHSVSGDGATWRWSGGWKRFDTDGGNGSSK